MTSTWLHFCIADFQLSISDIPLLLEDLKAADTLGHLLLDGAFDGTSLGLESHKCDVTITLLNTQ